MSSNEDGINEASESEVKTEEVKDVVRCEACGMKHEKSTEVIHCEGCGNEIPASK